MKLPAYIYGIEHKPTGKIYIGLSCRPEIRFASHMSALRCGKHNVEDMQSDFNKYGDDYEMTILDTVSCWSERSKELEWMQILGTNDRNVGYNYNDRYFKRKYDESIVPKYIVPGIAKKLVALRGNVSRLKVAEDLGISPSTLSMYERGERVPKDNIKIRIAKYYNVSIDYLFYQND